MDIIHLIGQVLFGGYFVLQGINHFKNSNALIGYAVSKNVPSPKIAILGSGALVFLGGLSVLLYGFIPSLWTEIGFIFLVIFLIPVSFKMHAFWNVADPQAKMMEKIQFMKNMALLGAVLSMIYW
jgi:uncharacterized membrane protein YphA (DoxX/SURF4 family)